MSTLGKAPSREEVGSSMSKIFIYPRLPVGTLARVLAQTIHFAWEDFYHPDEDRHDLYDDLEHTLAHVCACFVAQNTVDGDAGIENEYALEALQIRKALSFPERLALAEAMVAECGGEKPNG